MERYLKVPNPDYIAKAIYDQVIHIHETGGRGYYYKIPYGLSVTRINEIIERLGELLLDADVIELCNGYIIVDWS